MRPARQFILYMGFIYEHWYSMFVLSVDRFKMSRVWDYASVRRNSFWQSGRGQKSERFAFLLVTEFGYMDVGYEWVLRHYWQTVQSENH